MNVAFILDEWVKGCWKDGWSLVIGLNGRKQVFATVRGRKSHNPHIAGEWDEPEKKLYSVCLKDCGPDPHCTEKHRFRDGKGLVTVMGFITVELGTLASFLQHNMAPKENL